MRVYDVGLGVPQRPDEPNEAGRVQQPAIDFVAGDALALPFRDDTFDAVTISYGLRNVEDTRAALTEMLRVTRPGGLAVLFRCPWWAIPCAPWPVGCLVPPPRSGSARWATCM